MVFPTSPPNKYGRTGDRFSFSLSPPPPSPGKDNHLFPSSAAPEKMREKGGRGREAGIISRDPGGQSFQKRSSRCPTFRGLADTLAGKWIRPGLRSGGSTNCSLKCLKKYAASILSSVIHDLFIFIFQIICLCGLRNATVCVCQPLFLAWSEVSFLNYHASAWKWSPDHSLRHELTCGVAPLKKVAMLSIMLMEPLLNCIIFSSLLGNQSLDCIALEKRGEGARGEREGMLRGQPKMRQKGTAEGERERGRADWACKRATSFSFSFPFSVL